MVHDDVVYWREGSYNASSPQEGDLGRVVRLEQAHAESMLPAEPTTRRALEAFVVAARLRREEG